MKSNTNDDWVTAADGVQGQFLMWEDEYGIFDQARSMLALLEEIGEDSVDWDYLLNVSARLPH